MDIQLTLATAAIIAAFTPAAITEIMTELKCQSQLLTFRQISGFHLIAGFKEEEKAGLMQKQNQISSIPLIKTEAVRIELINEENKKRSHIGTNYLIHLPR